MKIQQQKSSAEIAGMVVGLILILIFTPLITLWSLNTLFSLGLPYTFATWGAVVWFKIIIAGMLSNTSKRQ